MTDWLMIAAGLVLLFGGGEALVRGAVGLSRRMGISELAIGLTVVGFGTSMPELLVSADAALGGKPGIALGNVIGSNTANILLILGLSALIAPVTGWSGAIRRDVTVMVAAAVLALALGFGGSIGRWHGAIMLVALGAYLFWTFRQSQAEPAAHEHVAESHSPLWLGAFLVGGLAALFAGAHFLVEGATSVARNLGVPEAIIGLTIVAVGTSLPELAASAMAAYRKHPEIAVGNILGSNIFNILAILGVTAMIYPIPVDPRFARLDMPAAMAAALAMLALAALAGRVSRLGGAALIAGYAGYLAVAS